MNAANLAARLARMSRKEIAFRLRVAARAEAARVAAACREPRWRIDRLAGWLERDEALVARAAERLEVGDRHGAHGLLRSHFRARATRFPLSAGDLGAVRDRVLDREPGAAAAARAEAGRIEKGRFDLLGYRDLDFAVGVSTGPAAIDWNLDPVHGRRAPRTWWSRVPFLDPSVGDHKIIWELNRHQHFLRLGRAAWLTGDRACHAAFESHVRGWLAQNPPGIGINWASMLELGLRSISWLWALHLFACLPDDPRDSHGVSGGEAWMPDLLVGLHVQLEQVRGHLSRYFSPNTHLTGEALALYVCGRALPELRASRTWADTGRALLVEQIAVQVTPDGGHCERSTHYLRYTLDFYLMALAFARATGDESAAVAFQDASSRLAAATRALCDVNGRLPMIGDDDGGRLWPMRDREVCDVRDSLAIAAALLDRPDLAAGAAPEEALWLVGPGHPSLHTTRGGPGAGRGDAGPGPMGYFVARPRPDDHLVVDGGPHGFLNGGHAHADALSLVCTVSGRPLLIDPGTFTYTMSPLWRDRLRSSAWHNTLTLDGRSQSVPRGPFHWERTANAAVQARVPTGECAFFEGVHDGYLPLVHRRRVAALSSGPLVVVDSVFGGGGRHLAEVHWHLHPAWKAARGAQGRIALEHEQGDRVDLVVRGDDTTLFAGDEATGLGWHSPVYGQLAPCTTVRLSAEGELPLVVVSAFIPGGGDARLERVFPLEESAAAGQGSHDDSVAVRLHVDGIVETLLFTGRPPVLPGQDRPEPGAAAPPMRRFLLDGRAFVTGARFAWMRSEPTGRVSLRAAVEGTAAAEDSEETHVRHRRIRRG